MCCGITARLTELGWPSGRDEHWRYTNLRAYERLNQFRPTAGGAELPPGTLPPELPGFTRLVCVDGRRVAGSHPLLAAPGAGADGALTPRWDAEQRLGLLADIFAVDPIRLEVRGEAAIEVLFLAQPGLPSYPRLELHLAPGSRLRLIERHLGTGSARDAAGGPGLVACNVTAELARAASLTHYRLQQTDSQCIFSDTLGVHLAEQARYEVRAVSVGGGSARTSASVELAGRGAALSWAAIAAGRDEQVLDTSLQVRHTGPETATEEIFRGIADARARVAFSGHIRIDAAASGAQARQSLRGLIEGHAEIDLRPRLEILTDDVRASHGATTGRLDEDLLFYLLARGIDRPTARALLKWAFLGDVLREIDQPLLRGEAERVAAGQLPDVPSLSLGVQS